MKTLGAALLPALLLPASALAQPDNAADGVLVHGAGMMIYTYDKDVAGFGKDTCNGKCAKLWPPVPWRSTGSHRRTRSEIVRAWKEGEEVVLSCSALKRTYRDLLRGDGGDVRFVHLHGARALIAQRMAARAKHFMPASLLESQLRDLEPLQLDERSITLDVHDSPAQLVERVLATMGAG